MKAMKAISIKPYYAILIARGIKTLEVRTWKTNYRGKLLICATQPLGMALAVVDLVDCRKMTKADSICACYPYQKNAFVFQLENIKPIRPFRISGKQGIFDFYLPFATRLLFSGAPRNETSPSLGG